MVGLYNFLIIAHIVVSICLLLLIVFQKTSGDGLLASTNKNNLMSGDEVAGFVTKLTTVFAAVFIINTLAIAIIGSRISKSFNFISTNTVQDEKASPNSDSKKNI